MLIYGSDHNLVPADREGVCLHVQYLKCLLLKGAHGLCSNKGSFYPTFSF